MELIKTYTITGPSFTGAMKFKFDLEGFLTGFEVDFKLTKGQRSFLYSNFPFEESGMIAFKDTTKFTAVIGEPDISFDNLWRLYDLKVNKEKSQAAYNKLPEADKMKCFLSLKKYNQHLRHTKQAKAHLVTYINQKRYNDEL